MIRRATLDDLADVAALTVRFVREHGTEMPLIPNWENAVLEETAGLLAATAENVIFVADDGEQLTGVVVLTGGRLNVYTEPFACIRFIYVIPERRHTRDAHMLGTAAKNALEEAGVSAVLVHQRSVRPNHKFYKEYRFTPLEPSMIGRR